MRQGEIRERRLQSSVSVESTGYHHSIGRWNPVKSVIPVTSLDSNFRWNDEHLDNLTFSDRLESANQVNFFTKLSSSSSSIGLERYPSGGGTCLRDEINCLNESSTPVTMIIGIDFLFSSPRRVR